MKKKGLLVIGLLVVLLIASLGGCWYLYGRVQEAELRTGRMGGQLGETQEQLGYARDQISRLEQQLEEQPAGGEGAWWQLQAIAPLSGAAYVLTYEAEYGELLITLASATERDNSRVYQGPASVPVVSPEQERFAYISDYEWEVIGNLVVYEQASGNQLTVGNEGLPEQSKVKSLCWYDEQTVLAVVGPAYGTVSRGGDLYAYHLAEEAWHLLLETDEEQEIFEVSGLGPSFFVRYYVGEAEDEELLELAVETIAPLLQARESMTL